MKHGDKEKGKASKASSKKAGKGSTTGKSSKAVPVAQAKSKGSPVAKSSGKTASSKTATDQGGGNGKTRPRPGSDHGGFTNPLIASAFKRAVKKYPNSFRKLSD